MSFLTSSRSPSHTSLSLSLSHTLITQLCHTHTHTHTRTHLLRNSLSNYWCGMHRTCTNTSVNLTGMVGWPNVYIYILWHPSCARRHPGTVTAVPCYGPHLRACRPGPLPAGTFTQVPGGCLRWPPTPRDPGGPLLKIEVLHLFRWYTHTQTAGQMRWRWKWHESENGMKVT